MVLYKFGKVAYIGNGYIILERGGEGHMLQVPDTGRLRVDENRKIYIYKHLTEYKRSSFGFLSFKEWTLFQDLIRLAGIGPKLAFTLLEQGFERVCRLVATGDIETLASVPMISQKSAKQIIFQLGDKYKRVLAGSGGEIERILKQGSYSKNELRESLKRLGFQNRLIDLAIERNQEHENLDYAIQSCIQIISNASKK